MKHVKLFEDFSSEEAKKTNFSTFDEFSSYLEGNGGLRDFFSIGDKKYQIVEYGSTVGGFGKKGEPDFAVYRNTEEPFDEIYKEHLSQTSSGDAITQMYKFLKVKTGDQYDFSSREFNE